MSDTDPAADSAETFWCLLVRRSWEDPEFRKLLLGDPESVALGEWRRVGSDPADEPLAVEAARRIRCEGIPDSENEFAARPGDFVLGWRGDFEPIGVRCSGSPFERFETHESEPLVDELSERCPAGWAALNESARSDLRRDAQQLVGALIAQPVQMLYCLERLRVPRLDHGVFVARDWAGVREAVLKVYPALESVLSRARTGWVQATTSLLQRLVADRGCLSSELGVGSEARVDSVRPQLSDRHAGGQTVARVQFECGRVVFYKPRPMGLDRAWNHLLEEINNSGFEPDLRVLRVIARDGYGWMEAALPAHCDNAAGGIQYFRRAGALCCLGWVLGATDWHIGNIIAAGEYPVLVDCETFFSVAGELDASRGLQPLCFLPHVEPGEYPIDISGLGGGGYQPVDRRVPVWCRTVPEAPRLGYCQSSITPGMNIVHVPGQSISVGERLQSMRDGYLRMVAHIRQSAHALTANDGCISAMAGEPRRRIVRGTRQYYLALNASLQLRHLGSVDERVMACLFELPDASEMELAALLQLDIPRAREEDATKAFTLAVRRVHALDSDLEGEHVTEISRVVFSSPCAPRRA